VTKEKEKTQAELENEKIRDMMDNYDSLSTTDQNFLGLISVKLDSQTNHSDSLNNYE
jgi:hypothetical protein